MKNLIRSVIFLVLGVVGSAYAEQDQNTIDYVDPEYKHVVIGDRVFYFALNAVIYDKSGRKVNRYALKEGMLVSYDFKFITDQSGTISEVKILEKKD